ncbi:IscS subfamily cysteine desulfurase [Salibacterium aidingense]|uniref:IscS subfamily cysteine desulfurase n=1 Tax=Salibacterium aidingense TaxID=384933 RepID=UPI00040F6F6E|nr:IscS subfamily cysteine desulfurase [Salibacterium aidingense]
MIYLDHCATTPMSSGALETYTKTAQAFFGNEQSLHDSGGAAAQLTDHCQEQLAGIIRGVPEGMYFTSGGSDSNISALFSLAYGREEHGRHIITSPLEHPSIYQALGKLKEEGFTVSEVQVKRNGEICLDSLAALLRDDTILVTVCHASSETGVIQPVVDIGNLLTNHDAAFHSDAVQTFTKIPLDVNAMGMDAVSVSAHKLNGPKNTGACYIAPGTSWKSMYPGISHQNGFRPGTLDVPGIAAFTEAALSGVKNQQEQEQRWRVMQEWFLAQLPEDSLPLFGDKRKRLPHHLALRLKKREGQWVMLECNRRGIAISAGSACKSHYSKPSKSLLAMGHTQEEAHGLFRLSFGIDTTYEELEQTAAVLKEISSVTRTDKGPQQKI